LLPLQPIVRPVLQFLENITPTWLTVENSKPLFIKCLQAPRTKSFRRQQMRGKSRVPKTPGSNHGDAEAAAPAGPMQLPQLTEATPVHHD
jgi:hypothetical protein